MIVLSNDCNRLAGKTSRIKRVLSEYYLKIKLALQINLQTHAIMQYLLITTANREVFLQHTFEFLRYL